MYLRKYAWQGLAWAWSHNGLEPQCLEVLKKVLTWWMLLTVGWLYIWNRKKCLDEKCPDFLIMWSTDIVNILDFNDDRSTVVIMTWYFWQYLKYLEGKSGRCSRRILEAEHFVSWLERECTFQGLAWSIYSLTVKVVFFIWSLQKPADYAAACRQIITER